MSTRMFSEGQGWAESQAALPSRLLSELESRKRMAFLQTVKWSYYTTSRPALTTNSKSNEDM